MWQRFYVTLNIGLGSWDTLHMAGQKILLEPRGNGKQSGQSKWERVTLRIMFH